MRLEAPVWVKCRKGLWVDQRGVGPSEEAVIREGRWVGPEERALTCSVNATDKHSSLPAITCLCKVQPAIGPRRSGMHSGLVEFMFS